MRGREVLLLASVPGIGLQRSSETLKRVSVLLSAESSRLLFVIHVMSYAGPVVRAPAAYE
jgi:hypothetical protein